MFKVICSFKKTNSWIYLPYLAKWRPEYYRIKDNGYRNFSISWWQFFHLLIGSTIFSSINEMEQQVDGVLGFWGLCYLLDFDYPHQYKTGLKFGNRSIPGDMLDSFNIVFHHYNIFKTGWLRYLFIMLLANCWWILDRFLDESNRLILYFLL